MGVTNLQLFVRHYTRFSLNLPGRQGGVGPALAPKRPALPLRNFRDLSDFCAKAAAMSGAAAFRPDAAARGPIGSIKAAKSSCFFETAVQ